MAATGGYQMGGHTDYVGWRCAVCGEREVRYGRIVEGKFVERPRSAMTVLVAHAPLGGVICRGISRDETVFRDALFDTAETACDYINRKFGKDYKCIFNLPRPT